MNKLFRYIFLILFYALIIPSYGQINGTITKMLDSSALTKKSRTVILMKTDTFTVLTTYKIFIDNCYKFIKEYDLDWDKELIDIFLRDTTKIIYAEKITGSSMQKSRLIFRISSLLEKGNCLVYNNFTKKLERKIITEKYITQFVIGKQFKTSDNWLILKTVDGVF